MSVVAAIPIRRRIIIVNAALGGLFLVASVLVPRLHSWTVTGPAERHFNAGIDQILAAERTTLKRHGHYIAFGSAMGAPERVLAGIEAPVLRTDLFAYRATPTADGGLILTAWTRPDAVLNSGTPAFAAVYELSPQGRVLRSDRASTHDQSG